MVANGANDKISKAFGQPIMTRTIRSQSRRYTYIHNRFFTPIDTHLRAAWDNGQPLFEKIWQ